MLNLATLLTQSARDRPEKTAIIMGDNHILYRELDDAASRIANMARAGVGRGDKVALTWPNTPFFPMVYHGILKMGAVVAPLNVHLPMTATGKILKKELRQENG